MKRNKYLAPQRTLKVGVGPNGKPANGWWYGEDKSLAVYIDSGNGCHWAKIPRKSVEAWLRATPQQSGAQHE